MGFFEWYFGLSAWVRLVIPLILLGISGVMFLNGRVWPFGIGLGVILLITCIPGKKSEWGDW